MTTKKDMTSAVNELFWSDLLTSEAKEDFLEKYPDQEVLFERQWDKQCGVAAKHIVKGDYYAQ